MTVCLCKFPKEMDRSNRYFIVLIIFISSISVLKSSNIENEKLIESYLASTDPAVHNVLFEELIYESHNKSFDNLMLEAKHLDSLSLVKADERYLSFSYSLIGDAYYLTGVYDSAAVYYLLQAECLLTQPSLACNNNLIATGYGNSATSLNLIGQKNKAIRYGNEALRYAKLVGEIEGEADAHYVLASAHYGLYQLDSAMLHLNRCYEIDLLLQDTRGLISVQYMIGNLYTDQNKNDLALEMYRKAMQQIPDSSSFERLKISGYQYIAEIHSKQKNIDSSLYYLKLGLAVPEAAKVFNINATLKSYIAQLHLRQDDLTSAAAIFESIDTDLLERDKSNLTFQYLKLCVQVNTRRALLEEAEACLSEALSTIDKNNLQNRKIVLYPVAVEFYEKKNDHKMALSFSKKLTRLTKELNTNKLENEVLKTKHNYETQNLQNANEIIQLEKDLLDEKLSKRNILAFFLVGFSLLSILSLYYFFRQSKIKERMQLQIQEALIEKKERKIIEKDMQALRSQMNPHFMFNSLSSINHYIMNEEPRNASRFLTKFASLMRTILSNSQKRYISLAEELKGLKLYTEIENLRFDNRFNFNFDIDDSIDLDRFHIPPMLLQPYVENSIKHAFVDVDYPPQINIYFQKSEEGINIAIEDNGIGRSVSLSNKKENTSIQRPHGMDITKGRLELISKLYNVDCNLVIKDKVDAQGVICGTGISLHIPLIKESQV